MRYSLEARLGRNDLGESEAGGARDEHRRRQLAEGRARQPEELPFAT